MAAPLHRVFPWCLALLAVVSPRVAPAQSSQQFPYLAALSTDQPIRAGADVRYYPFGELRAGDVVRVTGQKNGYARVATAGPAFQQFFGFVRYAKAGTSHLARSTDGRSATTTGPTDVFAPNLDQKQDPGSSWKPIVTLAADRVVVVIETMESDQEVVHRIALPPDAEGWIDLKTLRAATPSECAVWDAAVRDAPPRAVAAAAPAVVPVQQEPTPRVQLDPTQVAEASPAQQPAPPAPQVTRAPAALPRPAPQPSKAQIMLEDLEAAYSKLLKQPVESAEVEPLRLLYQDLASSHPDSRTIARYAQTRARQLSLWAEAQARRVEMKGVMGLAQETTQSAEAARKVIESLGQYAAVGRLDASTIYDGQRLPKLLRVTDPRTGRTVAYVQPDPRIDHAILLGQEVGVMGEWSEDSGLRVDLIIPRRIDPL